MHRKANELFVVIAGHYPSDESIEAVCTTMPQVHAVIRQIGEDTSRPDDMRIARVETVRAYRYNDVVKGQKKR